jgi:hypothetical protein
MARQQNNFMKSDKEEIMLKINTKPHVMILTLTVIMGLMVTAPTFSTAEVAIMSKEELKDLLGSETLTILDVRKGRDWSSSEFKIQAAQRADPREFEQWSVNHPKDNTMVLYCA